MCKQIILTNASNIEDFEQFSKDMAELLSDQRDGYGMAVQGKDGVFGVRTTNPMSYVKAWPDFVDMSPVVKFGKVSEVIGAALFHGRTCTNKEGILNTHPIQRDGWTLIHNGVVTHHGAKYDMLTQNDTEHVLFNLIQGIDQVATNLTGYYAAGAFDPNGALHVFRDNIASLFWAHSKELDSDIFATTEALILAIGEMIEEKLSIGKMKSDTYLIFKNGELISQSSFKSRGYGYDESKWASHSLGHSLDSQGDFYDAHETKLYSISDDYSSMYDIASDEYLDELEYIDETYTITLGSREIDLREFAHMLLVDKVACTIRRADGSMLDPYADNEKVG